MFLYHVIASKQVALVRCDLQKMQFVRRIRAKKTRVKNTHAKKTCALSVCSGFASEALAQSTVEYALVLGICTGLMLCLIALLHAMTKGSFLAHVITWCTHTFQGHEHIGAWQDALLF